MIKEMLPDTTRRVKFHTKEDVNEKIKTQTINNISNFIGKTDAEISIRIKELDKEWDIERTLETNADIAILITIILGFLFSTLWFVVTGIIAAFLLQHALQGWCPPLPIFRRMGIRTASEIHEEKMALKYLRENPNPSAETPDELFSRAEID